jgi:hypothetical protein
VLLVGQTRPEVTVWRRDESPWTSFTTADLDAVLPRAAVPVELPLRDVYRDSAGRSRLPAPVGRRYLSRN